MSLRGSHHIVDCLFACIEILSSWGHATSQKTIPMKRHLPFCCCFWDCRLTAPLLDNNKTDMVLLWSIHALSTTHGLNVFWFSISAISHFQTQNVCIPTVQFSSNNLLEEISMGNIWLYRTYHLILAIWKGKTSQGCSSRLTNYFKTGPSGPEMATLLLKGQCANTATEVTGSRKVA